MAREMIDSGIEWVGDIPAKWGVYPARYAFSEIRTKNVDGSITNALKFFNGTIIPKANFDADSDDYVAETITNYTIVEPDTIMINGLNLNYDLKSLRVGLVKETGVITSAYLALWPDKSRILPQYATYLFKGYETKMAFHNMGAGIRKTLGFKEFKCQPILIPEMVEQHRIVSFLDTECDRIDAVIEQTRASIEEYKKLKQSVITQAVTKGIRPVRSMKDSGSSWIGVIPSDWNVVQLKRIARIQTGSTPSKTENDKYYSQDSGYLWIKAEDLGTIKPIDKTTEYLTEDGIAAGRLFPPNTVFVCCIASVGKVGYCNMSASCNQQINGLTFYNAYWKYGFYVTIAQEAEYINNASGNVMKIINSDKQSRIMCPLPPIDEQHSIADYLDEKCAYIDALIGKKELLLSDLEKFKQSLVFEYVTGKKEVV